VLVFIVVLLFGSTGVWGDWDDTMPFKWVQHPDLEYTGMDIDATTDGIWPAQILADDFECTVQGPITDIHIWGSWLNDFLPYGDDPTAVSFTISIHADIPADDPGGPGYSMPGDVLWLWTFNPGEFTVRPYATDLQEDYFVPCLQPPLWLLANDTICWQYNFYIDDPDIQFIQQGTTADPCVYWIDVQAQPLDTQARFGWKTSLEHWNDDAVWGQGLEPWTGPWYELFYPDGHPYQFESIDLAFVIDGSSTQPDELEYGDAPEGGIAYPSLGVTGAFPTCITIGLQGYVEHDLSWPTGSYFGPSVDGETDGDASLCPPPGCFPSYDDDECYQDGDAGLVNFAGLADSFTIDSTITVVPCVQGEEQPLGTVCQMATWGVDIDIDIVETADDRDSYVNVLADWNRSGEWSGASDCIAIQDAPEHVLVNWRVPDGYVGPLSNLAPPGFLIGPEPGHVWFRFTIIDQDDGPLYHEDWNGEGDFAHGGETEDYLLLIEDDQPDELDFGDANDPTYPTLLANNGARHIIGGPYFCSAGGGGAPDPEPDGQPTPWADGDDFDADGDDEDGVIIPFLSQVVSNDITVYVCGGGGVVQIWVDFDGSGSWEAAELVFNGLLPDGVHAIPVTAPLGSIAGTTFARCRISTAGGLDVTGQADDGEVEDHTVEIEEAWEPKPPTPHLKWSQPPIEWDPTYDTPVYCGWDEKSWRDWVGVGGAETSVVVADDFRCLGTMPITSIHWWGSYFDWEDPDSLPPELPIGWRIGFWTNVAASAGTPVDYSYPEVLLWQIEVDDPRVSREQVGTDDYHGYYPYDVCYQYYVDLEEEEVFWQNDFIDRTEDNTFWLSITAIYREGALVDHPWGWKTRPWHWMDDAVVFSLYEEPQPGVTVIDPAFVNPIEEPIYQESVDVSFELDTDPNYIKWEQPFNGFRRWLHYEDEVSMGIVNRWTETKWLQMPDLTPDGMDVDVTDGIYSPMPMFPPQVGADDFQCTVMGPVTDIRIWGSWFHDMMPFYDPMAVEFTLCIYSDNSSGPMGWSEPDVLLWSRDFMPGEFGVLDYHYGLEGYFSPCIGHYERDADSICWQYDFHIDEAEAFMQTGTADEPVVYWLGVQARPLFDDSLPEDVRFGWKTSNEHWNDDAVWADGYWWDHGPWIELLSPLDGTSLDLAFEITSDMEELNIVEMAADDWPCDQNTPITAVAWWGSYIGYRYEACQDQVVAPPVKPDYFLLQIWTDIPDPDPGDPTSFSQPGDPIWEYKAYDYDEVLVGYDKYPEGETGPRETVFRYSVRLPKDDWFIQESEKGVYWLSVLAVYDESDPIYDWGWTNHEHMYNDNAVTGVFDPLGEPQWMWSELFNQVLEDEDLSFILFTEPDCLSRNAPGYNDWNAWGRPKCWCYPKQCRGDLNGSSFIGKPVTMVDLNLFKLAYNKTDAVLVTIPDGICADLNHASFIGKRVTMTDLNTFKLYYNKLEAVVPVCDQVPITTGPYNFWTSP